MGSGEMQRADGASPKNGVEAQTTAYVPKMVQKRPRVQDHGLSALRDSDAALLPQGDSGKQQS